LVPPGGYQDVIRTIYEASNPNIRFNQKVVAIDYSGDLVSLITQDGSIYHSKAVISSLPLGVLKKNLVTFSPQLPASYFRAINSITCGIANKIYLKFEEDFWTKKGDWIFLYSEESFKFNVIVNEAQTSKNVMCVKVAGFESSQLYQKSD
jgi:monoamine oxidase